MEWWPMHLAANSHAGIKYPAIEYAGIGTRTLTIIQDQKVSPVLTFRAAWPPCCLCLVAVQAGLVSVPDFCVSFPCSRVALVPISTAAVGIASIAVSCLML
jgi:hypothetical protein